MKILFMFLCNIIQFKPSVFDFRFQLKSETLQISLSLFSSIESEFAYLSVIYS